MRHRAFFLAAMLLVLSQAATAQVLYGSIVGNVTDESNASVPRATVKIVHLESNQVREFETSDVGGYELGSANQCESAGRCLEYGAKRGWECQKSE